jgi:hypothetical protein
MGIEGFDMPGGGKIIRLLSPELRKKEKYYTVSFSDDYATLQTTVAAFDKDEAVDKAIDQVSDYYDLDITTWKCDEVEETNG